MTPLLKTNLDTNFLKLVAIISMTIDHVGAIFFPAYPIFRWLGRLAFPLFCYCMVVGMLYTHNICKYLGRMAIFAVVSQPFWILAFNPQDIWGNLTNWNIFFTLFLSLLAVWGFKERKWWLFILSFLVISLWNFDYSYGGILLMLVFYLFRNKPKLCAAFFLLNYASALFFASVEDPLSLIIGGHPVGWSFFAVLALPLILIHTNLKLKIPKWFFYAFYPGHLAVLALTRWLMGV